MTTKTKVIISLVALVTSFAVGRYSVQSPEVKTHESTQTDTDTQIDKNTHKVTTITEDKDGKKVTTITEDSNTKADKTKETNKTVDQTITPPKTNTLNVSALAGLDTAGGFKPVYGASVSKQILGPITGGLFGLTNGTVGVSIGLNF